MDHTGYRQNEPHIVTPHAVAMGNPYLKLFTHALQERGISCSDQFHLSPQAIWRNRDKIHAVHLHWPEFLARRWRSLARVLLSLGLIKALGIRLIWTVHNLVPHETNWHGQTAQLFLGKFADLLICHTKGVADESKLRFAPRGTAVVMPLGNYSGAFPTPRPRNVVAKELGLNLRVPTLLCAGYLRDYKNIELIVEAVRGYKKPIQLIIAGKPHQRFEIGPLERTVDGMGNVVLIPNHLSDQRLADLHGLSDAVLLAYSRITGSAALLTAWTFGVGVIASDLGYFREMIPEESNAGTLFANGDVISLREAIERYLAITNDERRGSASRMAAKYDWDRCVQPVVSIFRKWWS